MAIGTAALLGSAGIGAAANLIGNIFGKKSNDNANKTNLRIAQMNNEWSERMMQKQMDYNTGVLNSQNRFAEKQAADANAFTEKMWNKTNEYNSAQAQAERLRAAGLNPALVMSGQNAGTAQGASAAQAATPSGNSVGLPSPSNVSVNPYRYDLSGVGAAATALSSHLIQRDLNDAQIRLLDKQTQWYDAKAQQELSEARERTSSYRLKNVYQNVQNQWANDQFSADYYKKIREGWSAEANAKLHLKQAALTDKAIMRYDERTNAEIADLVASTALKYSQGQLNREQLKNVIEDTLGKRLSNREKDAIFDYVVEKSRIEANPKNATSWFNDLFGDRLREWNEKMKWKPIKFK